jgi:GDPmannose 4,6-dehydratase
MNKKTVIITGGGGQDSALLLEYLSDIDGYEIHYVGGDPKFPVKVHYELDLSKRVDNELLAHLRPDYWFNFAALSSPKKSCENPVGTLQVNTLAVAYQLEAIKNHSPLCRYFNAGSVLETDKYISKFDPRTPYAISKLAAHQMVNFYRQQGLYAVQGILGLHESKLRQGDFLFKNIVAKAKEIVKSIEEGERFDPIEVYNPNALINISLAKDVVEIIWEAMQWEEPEDFVVESACPIYLREFIEKTFQSLGIECYWTKDQLIFPDYAWKELKPKSAILAKGVENEPVRPKPLQSPKNTYWTNSTIDEIIKELV